MSLITFLQADAPEMVLEADAPKCDAHWTLGCAEFMRVYYCV